MTTAIRTTRRTSYPALMLFGIVYIATLALVVSPQSFRSDGSLPGDVQTELNLKGTP